MGIASLKIQQLWLGLQPESRPGKSDAIATALSGRGCALAAADPPAARRENNAPARARRSGAGLSAVKGHSEVAMRPAPSVAAPIQFQSIFRAHGGRPRVLPARWQTIPYRIEPVRSF